MLDNRIRQLFTFTRAERMAVIILAACIIITIILRWVTGIIPGRMPSYAADKEMIDSFYLSLVKKEPAEGKENIILAAYDSLELFPFDPNTAGEDELLKLGLSSRQAQTLINYRKKGGRFFRKQDMKKIYGLPEEQYLLLEPYISILSRQGSVSDPVREKGDAGVKYPLRVLEINTADSSDLDHLPGIGEVLAGRIIRYRNLLGGFASTAQLKEVYGMNDSLYHRLSERIWADTLHVRRINLNHCRLRELARHPYLDLYQARSIIEFRNAMHSYSRLDELVSNRIIPREVYDRIRPYLSVE